MERAIKKKSNKQKDGVPLWVGFDTRRRDRVREKKGGGKQKKRHQK